MRELVLTFTLTTLILVTSSCQESGAPTASVREDPSPAPTPEIGVTFATLTPGPRATGGSSESTEAARPAPTVIPTAALVTYVVQSGDTLVDIAAANGILLDDLLALNPEIQPELLLVGQQLFLPPVPTDVAPTVTDTDQTVALEIGEPVTYSSTGGGAWVLGEVENVGDQTAELIQVRVTLLDQDDLILAEETVWVTPVTLRPGGKAPYGLLFDDIDGDYARVKAAIAGGRPAYELGSRYLDLAVSGAEVNIGRNPIEVTGRLDNLGGKMVGQISVIATFYGDQGAVSGFHEERLEGALAPGESMPFRFIALPPGGRAEAYAFATQAVVLE